MTMRLPQPGLADRILGLFGKRRGVVVPKGTVDSVPYGQVYLQWEGFWSALLRSADAPLPDGVIDTKDFRA